MVSLKTALEMSKKGNIEEWVHNFLLQPDPHGNIGLSEGLKLQKRYWFGPVKIELLKLIQGCGPDPKFKFHEPKKIWDYCLQENIERLKKGEIPPPLITEFDNNKIHIADGNHRFAALKEFGYDSYWCIIWFNSKEDHRIYTELENREF